MFCFNEKVVDHFIERARMYLKLQEAKDEDTTAFEDQEDIERILEDSISKPILYHLPETPGMFCITNIEDITETPMHLAMNAQKSVLKTIYDYTTSRLQSPEFTKRCRSLISLIKDVSKNILPVLNFKDAWFGEFVAENYAAVTMILPWLSRILEEDRMKLGKQEEPPDPAIKPYTK